MRTNLPEILCCGVVEMIQSPNNTLLQILLGRGIHIDFSSQLKFAKIGFHGAFHL